jgi:hypothetical protein
MLVQISWECTPPYPSTGISNLLLPAQAEVVLGQLSTYLATWVHPKRLNSRELAQHNFCLGQLEQI